MNEAPPPSLPPAAQCSDGALGLSCCCRLQGSGSRVELCGEEEEEEGTVTSVAPLSFSCFCLLSDFIIIFHCFSVMRIPFKSGSTNSLKRRNSFCRGECAVVM